MVSFASISSTATKALLVSAFTILQCHPKHYFRTLMPSLVLTTMLSQLHDLSTY